MKKITNFINDLRGAIWIWRRFKVGQMVRCPYNNEILPIKKIEYFEWIITLEGGWLVYLDEYSDFGEFIIL